MGKKYIIEIGRLERLYKAFVGAHGKPSLTWLSPEVDMTPYTEPNLGTLAKENFERGYRQRKAEEEKEIQGAYQRGLADAWDAARKIVLPGDVSGIYLADLEEIFDRSSLQDVIKDYSASECIEKIRQYERRQEEDGLRQNIQTIVDQCGYSLDEIAEVLAKMKETNNG